MSPAALGQYEEDSLDPIVSTIDPTVSDISSNAHSLRVGLPSLRHSTNFERIYAMPGQDGLLMRRAGGITAVFPRSEYTTTRDGVIPNIPADTIFYLGDPRAALGTSELTALRPAHTGVTLARPVGMPVSERLTNLASEPPRAQLATRTAAAAEAGDEPVTLAEMTISDERYRRSRLRTISRQLSRQN